MLQQHGLHAGRGQRFPMGLGLRLCIGDDGEARVTAVANGGMQIEMQRLVGMFRKEIIDRAHQLACPLGLVARLIEIAPEQAVEIGGDETGPGADRGDVAENDQQRRAQREAADLERREQLADQLDRRRLVAVNAGGNHHATSVRRDDIRCQLEDALAEDPIASAGQAALFCCVAVGVIRGAVARRRCLIQCRREPLIQHGAIVQHGALATAEALEGCRAGRVSRSARTWAG